MSIWDGCFYFKLNERNEENIPILTNTWLIPISQVRSIERDIVDEVEKPVTGGLLQALERLTARRRAAEVAA
ncbi:hypothetical protein F4V91_06795 [Neorhizobium galegae]|uniref:Uncharacterized protein n=1 Tax=Neorhizobium galegae TaxID=399 RepID=A0A6A1TPM2_NEOGA|nr:hypothetical protein [Neorhizobium galegae]KAB1086166.1 hypothetical protein F4V91_06795 [Neorhizobium galegae]